MTASSSEPPGNDLKPLAGNPASASAMCKSVNPAPFHLRISSMGISDTLIPNSPAARISVSSAAIFSNLCRNHRVTPPETSRTSSIEYPRLNASNRAPILLSVGILNQSISIASGNGSLARSSIDSPPEASAIVSGLGWG